MNLLAMISLLILGLSHLKCTENIHGLMEFTIFDFRVRDWFQKVHLIRRNNYVLQSPVILNPIPGICSGHQIKIKGELIDRGFGYFRSMTTKWPKAWNSLLLDDHFTTWSVRCPTPSCEPDFHRGPVAIFLRHWDFSLKQLYWPEAHGFYVSLCCTY